METFPIFINTKQQFHVKKELFFCVIFEKMGFSVLFVIDKFHFWKTKNSRPCQFPNVTNMHLFVYFINTIAHLSQCSAFSREYVMTLSWCKMCLPRLIMFKNAHNMLIGQEIANMQKESCKVNNRIP